MTKFSFLAVLASSMFLFTACAKHGFESNRSEPPPVVAVSVDSLQISEITSGGGVSENLAEGIQVQATIGHLYFSQALPAGEIQNDLGIWNILGQIF